MALLVRYCVLCRNEIPTKRVMRGAATCSNECRRQHRNGLRQAKAEKHCRLCGRPPRKQRMAPITTQVESEAIRPCAPGAQGNVGIG